MLIIPLDPFKSLQLIVLQASFDKTDPFFFYYLVKGMRKEYGHARSLAIAQAQILQAYDEINMATSRLRLAENENDKSLDALSEHELPSANVLYTSDKFTSLQQLSCIKGKLRYLKVQTQIHF